MLRSFLAAVAASFSLYGMAGADSISKSDDARDEKDEYVTFSAARLRTAPIVTIRRDISDNTFVRGVSPVFVSSQRELARAPRKAIATPAPKARIPNRTVASQQAVGIAPAPNLRSGTVFEAVYHPVSSTNRYASNGRVGFLYSYLYRPLERANIIARATVNGVQSRYYRVGTVIPISAGSREGKKFKRWTGDVAAVSNPNSASTSLRILAGGVTVSAGFEPVKPPKDDTPDDNTPPKDDNDPPTDPSTPPAQPPIDDDQDQTEMNLAIYGGDSAASVRGVSLTGVVKDPAGQAVSYDVLNGNGDVVASKLVASLNPATGRFALRVHSGQLPNNGKATVLVRAQAKSGGVKDSITFSVTNETHEIRQLLARTTYGVTPDLLSRVQKMGFDAYLNEQLNPSKIDNRSMDALNVGQFYNGLKGHGDGKLLRVGFATAVYSERQLQEVMANFWENHFYTRPKKETTHANEMLEKEAFRASAFGKFRDLLAISSRSPSMMAYLDNYTSKAGKINENYAREVMELHTVGVNSSYTEEDIVQVAKILTGWGLRYAPGFPKDGRFSTYEFEFDASRHDSSEKYVSFLNLRVGGGTGVTGIREGEKLLDALASHPDTAKFICGKLVVLFVSDAPPSALVNKCAEKFLATGGDTRALLSLILTSKEFRATEDSYLAKLKTPYEYAASITRLTGITPSRADFPDWIVDMARLMVEGGYEPFVFFDPTGLPEASVAWMDASSLVPMISLAIRDVTRWLESESSATHALVQKAPAKTAEGIAVMICNYGMMNACTEKEFIELVNAAYGRDNLYDPSSDSENAVIRAFQVMFGSPSFGLQ